jgi:hypothetical protein
MEIPSSSHAKGCINPVNWFFPNRSRVSMRKSKNIGVFVLAPFFDSIQLPQSDISNEKVIFVTQIWGFVLAKGVDCQLLWHPYKLVSVTGTSTTRKLDRSSIKIFLHDQSLRNQARPLRSARGENTLRLRPVLKKGLAQQLLF